MAGRTEESLDALLDRAAKKGLSVQVVICFPPLRDELPLPPPLEERDDEMRKNKAAKQVPPPAAAPGNPDPQAPKKPKNWVSFEKVVEPDGRTFVRVRGERSQKP